MKHEELIGKRAKGMTGGLSVVGRIVNVIEKGEGGIEYCIGYEDAKGNARHEWCPDIELLEDEPKALIPGMLVKSETGSLHAYNSVACKSRCKPLTKAEIETYAEKRRQYDTG